MLDCITKPCPIKKSLNHGSRQKILIINWMNNGKQYGIDH